MHRNQTWRTVQGEDKTGCDFILISYMAWSLGRFITWIMSLWHLTRSHQSGRDEWISSGKKGNLHPWVLSQATVLVTLLEPQGGTWHPPEVPSTWSYEWMQNWGREKYEHKLTLPCRRAAILDIFFVLSFSWAVLQEKKILQSKGEDET